MKSVKELNVILDVSANAVPTVGTLKNFVKTIAEFGYSAIYISLADLFVIKDEPYFGYQRGRYDKNQINELDSYCKSLGVELRPFIQTLSHLFFIWKYSVYGGVMETKSVLLADKPETYTLIEKMFATVREYFSSDKIHIGMDDSYYVGRNRHLDLYGFEDLSSVYLRHLNKVVEIADKYGFNCDFWSEQITGNYFASDLSVLSKEEVRKDISKQLPKANLCIRNYLESDKKSIGELIDKNLKLSDEVSYTAVALRGYGFAPDNANSIVAVKAGVDVCVEKGIKTFNVLCPSEMGAEQSIYSALPTLFFASEYANGLENNALNKAKFKKIVGVEFDDFMLLDLPNKPHEGVTYDKFNTKSFFYLYNDPLLGLFDKLLSENTGKDYARVAKLLENTNGQKFDYIFKTASALCKVLSNKAELGKNIKQYYDESNKPALKEICDVTIPSIIRDLDWFCQVFEQAWANENKSFGFETQIQRIGGLIERLKTVSFRLSEYIDGKVSVIPELIPERIMPDVKTDLKYSGEINEDNYLLCDWNFIVTVSFT